MGLAWDPCSAPCVCSSGAPHKPPTAPAEGVEGRGEGPELGVHATPRPCPMGASVSREARLVCLGPLSQRRHLLPLYWQIQV